MMAPEINEAESKVQDLNPGLRALLIEAKSRLEAQTLLITRLREELSYNSNKITKQRTEIEDLKNQILGLMGQWDQTSSEY